MDIQKLMVLEPGLYDKDYKLVKRWDTIKSLVTVAKWGNPIVHIYRPNADWARMNLVLPKGMKIEIHGFNGSSFNEVVVRPDDYQFDTPGEFFWNANIKSVVYATDKKFNIGERTFVGSKIQKVTFPANMEMIIGKGAFENCTKLKSVELPNCVVIKDNVFKNCTSLTKIDLSRANAIGSYAFANTGITEANLEHALVVGHGAFCDCEKLKKAKISVAIDTGKSVFLNCESLEKADVSNLVDIGPYFFNGCKNLKTVKLSDHLKYISEDAFTGTSIDRMRLPKTLEFLSPDAFDETTTVYLERSTFDALFKDETGKYTFDYEFHKNIITDLTLDELVGTYSMSITDANTYLKTAADWSHDEEK